MTKPKLAAHDILRSIDDTVAMIQFSIDGEILWANKSFLKMMKYELDEIVGEHHKIFVPYNLRKTLEYKKFWRSFKNGKSYSNEFKRITKDREDIWLRGSYSTVVNDHGEITSVIKIAYNISEEKHRTLTHEQNFIALNKSNAIIEYDINGYILHANDLFLDLVKFTLKDIKGKHHSIFLSGKETNSLAYITFWETLRSGNFIIGEYKRFTRLGEELWIKATYNPIFDLNGNIEKIIQYATDITEKRKIEASRDEQIKAINRSGSIIEFDLSGNIIDINQNFLNLMNYGKKEVLGYHHSIFLSDEEVKSQEYQNFWQELRMGRFKSGEFQRFDKYGRSVWISGSYNPVFNTDGQVYKVMKFAFNITKTKEIERDLLEAKNLAEKAVQTKSTFLANMSHEIRTPLNGIIGCTNLLRDNIKDSEDSENKTLIETVVSCGDSLLILINDILDFSKIESEKMELEHLPFDLRSSVHQVIQLFNSKASEKSIIIKSSIDEKVPQRIYGDITRFKQVLSNLISNGIKFTKKGNISIKVQFIEHSTDTFYLQTSVKDSGIGIDQEGKRKLFKSFSQVDASTTKNYGGTGLGLVISKSLTELMGGKIWVESEKNKGATFHFSIQTQKAKDLPKPKNVDFNKYDISSLEQTYPIKILVADDNAVNQLVAQKLLHKVGYKVDIASDGNEAIEMLEKQKYDLIFMDCHMPNVDGFEATRRIVKKYGSNSPQIIALTASAMKEDKDKCIQSGMNGFITKPIELKEVIKVIKGLELNSHLKNKACDIIDESALIKHFDGDYMMLEEVSNQFISKTKTYLEDIKNAILNEDYEQLEMFAHKLKGMASNFYAKKVIDDSQKLEFLARNKSLSEVDKVFNQLEDHLIELNNELQNIEIKKVA